MSDDVFQLSPTTSLGFGMAHASAFLHEQRDTDPLPISEYSHGQMVQQAKRLVALTEAGHESDTWAMLSFYAAAFAGVVHERERADREPVGQDEAVPVFYGRAR